MLGAFDSGSELGARAAAAIHLKARRRRALFASARAKTPQKRARIFRLLEARRFALMAAGPLFLSQEAERTLKQCHGIRAGPDGRVLLHRAAEEAQQYGLWDHADLSERGAAAASETRARNALLTPAPLARRPVAPRRAAAHARARGHDALRELRRVRRARAARASMRSRSSRRDRSARERGGG